VISCESLEKTRKLDVICSDGGGLSTWRPSGKRGELENTENASSSQFNNYYFKLKWVKSYFLPGFLTMY
jgi:hypothetical protein